MEEYMPINPEVLKWARKEAGFSLQDMLKVFPKYEKWKKNEAQPIKKQEKEPYYKRDIDITSFTRVYKTLDKVVRARIEHIKAQDGDPYGNRTYVSTLKG